MAKMDGRRRARPHRSQPRLRYTDRAPTTQKRAATNLRLQGIALALGELAGTHLERDLAKLVMLRLGITFDDLGQCRCRFT